MLAFLFHTDHWASSLLFLKQIITPVDIDECISKTHNCDDDAVCTNNKGSFTCECETGYRGNGLNCTGNLAI